MVSPCTIVVYFASDFDVIIDFCDFISAWVVSIDKKQESSKIIYFHLIQDPRSDECIGVVVRTFLAIDAKSSVSTRSRSVAVPARVACREV